MINSNQSSKEVTKLSSEAYKPFLKKGGAISLGISLMALILFGVYSKHPLLYSLLFVIFNIMGILYLLDKHELIEIYKSPVKHVDYLGRLFLWATDMILTWGLRLFGLLALFVLNPIHVVITGVFAVTSVYGLSIIFNNVFLDWFHSGYPGTSSEINARAVPVKAVIHSLRAAASIMIVLFAVRVVTV